MRCKTNGGDESKTNDVFNDYSKYDGLGLAELIAKREVHPKEVLQAAIERAQLLNPQLDGDLSHSPSTFD